MTIGFRVLKCERRVSPAYVERFSKLPVANVSDAMSRMVAGGAQLRPLHRGGKLVGPAFTVVTRPGDNLMVHAAIDRADAGDVVVVDAGGDLTNAIVGELMIAYAAKRGLGGLVINGAIRDIAAIREGNFPVFAAGVTHRGPYKDGPGEVNVPIAIDGMVIHPGDLILGDDDGLVCVPYDATDEVLRAAEAKHKAETAQLVGIAEGRNDRSWVNTTLARLGCDGI